MYYQGISDSARILGESHQVVNIETHSAKSTSPHVGRGQIPKGELFTREGSIQPQVNLDDRRSMVQQSLNISSISGGHQHNNGITIPPVVRSSSRNIVTMPKAQTETMGGSFDDINMRQSVQKKDNEALQRIMAMGSEHGNSIDAKNTRTN